MIYRELITSIISGCGDVLWHQAVSKVKIILEFPLRQLHAIEAMGHVGNPSPITFCPVEELTLLSSYHLLLSCQIIHIYHLLLLSFSFTLPAHACPMAYVVEVGTS